MVGYSRPAIEFQAALQVGDKFTPIMDYAAHAGHVLTMQGLKQSMTDPDDRLYDMLRDDGLTPWVRCWWLRKCCYRVE